MSIIGNPITLGGGRGGGAAITITDTSDPAGGTVRTITAVDISSDTVTAAHLETGYTAHDAAGNAITGQLSPGSQPTLQTKTASYTPTETAQTDTVTADAGYDGLDEVDVTVAAIPSNYVGSGVARKSSSDLTASGATVTAPAGYYASNATKAVASGSATPASSISATGASVSTGTNTLTLSKSVSNTPQVSAGYVSSGTSGNSSVSLTASVTTKAAATIHPSTSDQSISSGTYLTGAQTIKAVTHNLAAENIKDGVTLKIGDSTDDDCVTSVTGTYSGGGSSKSFQINNSSGSIHTTTYTYTGISLTVAKAGTYQISWNAWRSSSTGTMGTNLYINDTAGTNQTTWVNNYGQRIELNQRQLEAGDVLKLYAISSSTSRYVVVSNLVIWET